MEQCQRKTSVILIYLLIISLFMLGTFIGNTAVTVLSEISPSHQRSIVIDPGHGGEDGGAISCTGVKESIYNLEIALRLDDLLHLLGYRTRMIRRTDTAIYTSGETIIQKKVSDLKERVKAANNVQNRLLISIHQNTFPEEKYSGAQVFHSDNQNSEALAKKMQQELINHLNPGSHRESKPGQGIYILENVSIPAVLIECGFISNSREEALLRNPEYQKKLCCVLAASTSGFLAST